MKKISKLLFLFSLILLSCASGEKKQSQREVRFIHLDKLSGKFTSSYNSKEERPIYIFIETVLIENCPQDRDSAFALQKEYFKKNNKICMMDSGIDLYSMRFYNQSECTEYFIANAEDTGGFSSRTIYDDCGQKDAWYRFYYKRDKSNSSLWITDMDLKTQKYQDSLYCDSKSNSLTK